MFRSTLTAGTAAVAALLLGAGPALAADWAIAPSPADRAGRLHKRHLRPDRH